jgi:hypothetical protein
LQVVAVDTTGVLWHTFRRADGSWVPAFGNVNQQASNGGSLHFGDASGATERNGSLHVIAVGTDGVLWHTIRHPDGSWVGAFDNVSQQNRAGLPFSKVHCALENTGSLQLVAADTTGVLWHTIRHADGSWVGAFGNVNQQESNGASLRFGAVSCATDTTGSLQLVARDTTGVLQHTIRRVNGSWVPAFGNVNQVESNGASVQFQTVSCA